MSVYIIMDWEYNDKSYKVYMIRVDTEHSNQNKLEQYVATLEPTYYLLANENKEDTTPHQQGALIFDKVLTPKLMTKVRNHLKTQKWVRQGKNAVALTVGRKPKSLLKYCNNKEKKGIATNMSETMLEEIGNWKDKELIKKQLKDSIIERYVKQSKNYQRNLFKIELIQIAVSVSIIQGRKPPPIKSLYYYAQLAKVLSPQQVAEYSYGYEYQSALQEAEQYKKLDTFTDDPSLTQWEEDQYEK